MVINAYPVMLAAAEKEYPVVLYKHPCSSLHAAIDLNISGMLRNAVRPWCGNYSGTRGGIFNFSRVRGVGRPDTRRLLAFWYSARAFEVASSSTPESGPP